MTCNKDCKNCVYGKPKERKVHCPHYNKYTGNVAITCNNNCDNCIYRPNIEITKWACSLNY